jgi:ATP-binding cassette subfamily G (WHITE) protein 2 (SNQ2)
MREQPTMKNTFSWQNLKYVSVSGERRQLLDNVSGYVALGKLTTLMGESGAEVKYLINAK